MGCREIMALFEAVCYNLDKPNILYAETYGKKIITYLSQRRERSK